MQIEPIALLQIEKSYENYVSSNLKNYNTNEIDLKIPFANVAFIKENFWKRHERNSNISHRNLNSQINAVFSSLLLKCLI